MNKNRMQTRKPMSFSDKKSFVILLKDLLIVLTTVFVLFSWIENRNPFSISMYLNHYYLIYIIAILAFLYIISVKPSRAFLIFYLSALLLVSEGIIKLLYYGHLSGGPTPNVLLSDYFLNSLLLLIVLSISYLYLFNSKNEANNKKSLIDTLSRKQTVYILIVIIFFAFVIRLWNLGDLSPVRDEFSHLNAAKRLAQEGFFNYHRTGILTNLVFWSWKTFNNGVESVFFARFVSAVLGTISIPLIFLLCRSFSPRSISLIAAFLLATSPFHVGMSRYTREYVLFFDILLISLFLIYKTLQCVSAGKKLKSLLTFVLLSPILLYYFYERNSTYPFVFVISVLFVFFSGVILLWENKSKAYAWFKSHNNKARKKIKYALAFLSLTIFLIAIKRFIFGNVHFKLHGFTEEWLEVFFSTSSPHQWFFNSVYSSSILVIVFIWGIINGFRKKFIFISSAVFIGMILIYSFFLNILVAPRYIFPLLIFVIIIFSYSIRLILRTVKPQNIYQNIILYAFLLSFFNPLTTILFIKNEKDGEVAKQQGLIHRDTSQLIDFLDSNGFINDDVVISPNKALFIYYYDYPFVQKPEDWPYIDYKYNKNGSLFSDYGKVIQKTDKDSILNYIKEFESGWIVIDKDRNRNWDEILDTSDFKVGDTHVEYLGDVGKSRGYDVYRWDIKDS